MRGASAPVLALLALLALATAAAAAEPAPLVQLKGGLPALGEGWRPLNLPDQKLPETRYAAELVDGRPALRIDARASYGNLALPLSGAAPATVAWSWRVDQANPAVDLRSKAGDDSPAKVCLSFDLPLDKLSFFERNLLRLARSRSAQPLPAATLCWVWGHAEPIGSAMDNAFTRRVRYVVLRGQADATGRWFEEQRDVAADFRATFGDESDTVPPLSAVLVGGDADNTGAQTLAFVAGLRFGAGRSQPQPRSIPAAGK